MKKMPTTENKAIESVSNILEQIRAKGLWCDGQPLRLHLGCGEMNLEGYINIDYPPSERNVIEVKADIYADITKLNFPAESVDEIRLHHVFEHFDRATALALLIHWHEWLKIGAKLQIETPDILKCAHQLVSIGSYKQKQAVIRHAFGSHEAAWAYHYDGWYAEKFQYILSRFGFTVKCRNWQWDHEPSLANVEAIAVKAAHFNRTQLLAVADFILLDSMVNDVPCERNIHIVWCEKMRRVLDDAPSNLDQQDSEREVQSIKPVIGIIFSKDRALQLDGMLKSFALHCKDNTLVNLKVIYKTSDLFHERLYQQLINDNPSVRFIREKNFKDDLIISLTKYQYVLFLVDDNIFIKDFYITDVVKSLEDNPASLGFSLRLGKNTTYCYPLNREQKVPNFTLLDHKVLRYYWTQAELDFGYPLEVSSSVYRLNDILPYIIQLPFRNPNTLEELMNRDKSVFNDRKPHLLCFESTVSFCAPLNTVQTVVVTNRASDREEYSPGNLAKIFNDGYRIDVAAYSGFRPRGCHQEVDLRLLVPATKSVNEKAQQQPLVTVIIPCYNYARYLPESVGSVLAQTYRDFEIIIVNDGSTDNSREVAERLIRENSGIPIRLINQSNSGQPAISRNRGISEARGEYVLCLDADDLIEPTLLRECVEVLDENPDISIAYTDQIHFKNGESHLYRSQDWNLRNLLTANLLPTCCLFHRRGWEDVGGYKTNVKGYEDWDFWISLGEKGYVGKRIAKPLYRYRLSDTGVFAKALNHDRQLRAQIVLNHPNLFSSDSIAKSEKLISESVTEPAAEGIGDKPSILIFHYEKPINPIGINAGAEMALIHTARALARMECRVTLAGNLGCPAGIYQQVRYVDTGRDFNYSRVLAEEDDRHDIIIASSRADVLKESLKYNNFKVRLLWMHVNSLSVARMAPTSIKQVCDAVLCVSEGQRKVMVGQGLDHSLTRILYNGSDAELFQPLPVKREPHRIVYAGALVRLKGVHNLVQAFQQVRQTFPDAVLNVFGSGDIWGEEDFIDYSGNKPEVTGMNFYGKVSQKRLVEAFSRSALTVVPSLLECNDSYPLSPLDAQACECPALVTPSGGLPETVEDGVTGRVLPDDSPESIAVYVIEMLSDQRKLHQMGKAGRKRILERCTWNHTAEKLLKIINDLNQKKMDNAQMRRSNVDSNESRIRQEHHHPSLSLTSPPSANGYKVAMITTFNQQCGLATYAGYLLEHYNPARTLILAEEVNSDRAGEDSANVVRCWRSGQEGQRLGADGYRLMESILRKFKPDIIHINYHAHFFLHPAFYTTLEGLKKEGIKVVASMHTTEPDIPQHKWLDRITDAVFVHMPYNQTQWASMGGNDNKVSIIPHGIPQLYSASYDELRNSLQIPPEVQLYVSCGFVEPHKGIAENIEALAKLKGQFPFIYIILGGAHPKNPTGKQYIEQCQQLVKKYNLEQEVQFLTGFQPFEHIWVLLNASDAILMNYKSNRYEGSGATAMALGSMRPIVVSTKPPFSDMENAVLRITEGYPLEKILLHLKANEGLRRYLAKNQMELVQERNWKKTAERIQNIYRQLVN